MGTSRHALKKENGKCRSHFRWKVVQRLVVKGGHRGEKPGVVVKKLPQRTISMAFENRKAKPRRLRERRPRKSRKSGRVSKTRQADMDNRPKRRKKKKGLRSRRGRHGSIGKKGKGTVSVKGDAAGDGGRPCRIIVVKHRGKHVRKRERGRNQQI